MQFRRGDKGTDVGRVRQQLVEAGYPIEQTELEESRFGHSMYDAVRQFQATHIDSTGHALAEDGVIGAETLWSLMHGAQSQRANRFTAPGWRGFPSDARADLVPVMQWAIGLIGLVEHPPGSNRGPRIDGWAEEAGLEPGLPWCALFVSAAYHRLPLGSPFGWLASAYKIKTWGENHARLVEGALLPGDIFVIMRSGFHGHVGLICGVDGGKVCTVEGNSSDACRGLIRDPSTFAAVVRPLPL